MKRISPTRRSFLRAMGAGFAALPFAQLLENSVAQAAGEVLPLKFITMYHPHGVAAELWAMKATDTETAFDIAYENCSLQPFDDAATYGKSFKDKILVIQGVDHLSNANGHNSAGTILTGSIIDEGAKKPKNISLDQYLAVSKGLGKDTRVTSVALGVGTDSAESGTTLSFGEGGAPLPKILDPVKAFELLFDGVVGATADPAATAAALRKRKMGQSVIDYAKWDIKRLRARLAPPEQQKLDQHLTSLSELEKQLGAGGSLSCAVPASPDASKFPKLKQYNGGEPYFDAITDAHIDVLAAAIACDVTRFGTLFMGDLSYEGNPLGLPADNHGSVAHTYASAADGNSGVFGARGNEASWISLAKFNRYSYSKVARLMQKLDAMGALDSTIIYASSDMGNPSLHSLHNVPTLIAGGTNGKFRMGRRIRMKPDCPGDTAWCDAGVTELTSNSKILVSIAQAFGVNENTFGTQSDPKYTTGALTEMA